MKKLALLSVALIMAASPAVFAEEHADAALEHTRTAIQYGKAGHNQILVEHAKEALIHAKMKGKDRAKAATKAAEEAAEHIKAGNQ
jgi:hypothetical protein